MITPRWQGAVHFPLAATLLALVLTPPLPAQEKPAPEKPAAAAPTKEAPWLHSLAQGLAQAQKTRSPVFVVVSGQSCPYCRLLEKEMKTPTAQKELTRWTLVLLDLDANSDDARTLAVGPIPALRALSPSGKSVAAHDGALSAAELASWLEEQYDAAAGRLAPELVEGEKLSALAAVKLVKEFRRRDPAVREAAIRRLLSNPEVGAAPVATAFVEGSLSTRLAALELLDAWKAPVEGLDPWRPETLTEARLKAVSEWADKLDEKALGALKKPKELSSAELATAGETLGRMLSAPPAEAAAFREQLARHGAALLPLVYERLKTADSDASRERLTALRYRLVAGDRLALAWPGGIERLAAADAATRRQAMDQLAEQAGPEDEALLLELFSDPEPLLRELALRALHRTSGDNANSVLVRLLDDPEPNVRAAILKQLAESPPASVIPKIAKYAEKETDPDLVVHAIRVLRESPVRASVERLTALLNHESWRVRAEAAEALGKVADRDRHGTGGDVENKADIYVAMIERLKDEDPFVVSRAVEVLAGANLVTAIDPLAESALRFPDLAVNVVTALARNSAGSAKVERHLQQFAEHADPRVRVAAIVGLFRINAAEIDVALKRALADADSSVRIAAAEQAFESLNDPARSSGFYDPHPPVAKAGSSPAPDAKAEAPPEETAAPDEKKLKTKAGDSGLFGLIKSALGAGATEAVPDEKPEDAAPTDPEADVTEARKKAPAWLAAIEPQLVTMLSAATAEERLAAALPLVVAGRTDKALPVLTEAAGQSPALGAKASAALFWLPWETRLPLYEKLLAGAKTVEQRSELAQALARRRDARAAESLWALLSRDDASGPLAENVLSAMRMYYLGNSYYDLTDCSKRDIERVRVAARSHAKGKARWDRLTAFSLLLFLGDEETEKLAREHMSAPDASGRDKLDALRVLLLAAEPAEATKAAAAALGGQEAEPRALALRYLSLGRDGLGAMEGDEFNLNLESFRVRFSSSSSPPKAPSLDSVAEEQLLPLLKTARAEDAAQVGYLLCLKGNAAGLAPLVNFWRDNKRKDTHWRKLVYTAVAALEVETHVPVLEEVYGELPAQKSDDYAEAAEFYWAIRGLTGPEVLALRKRIRDEVGMDNLRQYSPSSSSSGGGFF